MSMTASTESYAKNKKVMKICDKPVDHDGVDKVMQKNEKMTNFNDSSLQSDKVTHEEWNDAVILNGETTPDTDNDDQTNEPERKSNDIDSNETTMRNDETMDFDANFCGDSIVDDNESIDAKRTTENDDLMTENDARSDEDDTKRIEEEFEDENELTTETITILSESADKKPEIETARGLTEEQKKIDEKSIAIAMIIEQQQGMSDLRDIAGEIEEETEFTTETATSLSESTETTMEITTTKSLNEKEKKINEKTMETAMVIA